MRSGSFHSAVLVLILASTSRYAVAAEDPRSFWAFQHLKQIQQPQVRDRSRVHTPVDAFILAKLQERGLSFAPEASRPVLARRAFFDLIGLPPSPEQVAEFVNDPAPDAYERLLARLLAS